MPATKSLINLYDASEADMDVLITGYQWRWKYDYVEEDLSFFSSLSTPREQIEGLAPKGPHYLLEVDEPLVVPINKKIRFLITANDVIHAWWVPALGVKKDAIPGFIKESWAVITEPGTYRGQCAELCGRDHGFMPIVVEAKTEEDYRAWLLEKQAAAAAAILAGQTEINYTGSFAVNRLKVLNENVCSMGEVSELGFRSRQYEWIYRSRKYPIYRKLVTTKGRLSGILCFGDWDEVARVQEAWQNQRRIMPWQVLRFLLTGFLWG